MRVSGKNYFLDLVVGAGFVALAFIVRWLLDPLLGDNLPYVTFFPAIVVAAWYGGLWAALLATLLSVIVASYCFVPPRFSFLYSNSPHAVGMGAFLLASLTVAVFGGSLRAAERRSRRAEQAARHQEQTLRITLDSIGDAVIATDAAGNVNYLNAVAEELTGWTTSEAAGRPLAEVFVIVNEETRKPVDNPVEKVLALGRVVGLANHTILISKNGTERPIDDSAAPIRDEDGKIVGCVMVFRDVTERQRLERENVERLRTAHLLSVLVESSDDAIISKSLDGIIQSWNAAAERLFGYTAEQAVGRHISFLFPADRLDEEDQIIARLRAGERVENFDTVRLRSDGQPVPVSLTISPVRDEAGRVVGASKIVRDITDRKRGEEQLRQSEARFRSLANATPAIIWTADPTGTITLHNQRWLDYTGIDPAANARDWPSLVLHPDDHDRCAAAWTAALAAGTEYEIEVRNRRWDGDYRWFLTRAVPIRDDTGTIVEWYGSTTDIHDLKQAKEALQEADRRKDDFLALLAHELRNPLAPLRSGLQVLGLASNGPAVNEARGMMERQLTQLVRIVDDLLDISRITRDKLELRRERIDLATVVQSAVETSRPLIQEQGHQLQVQLPGEPIWLDADLTRLAQVFANLLNNSVKYTPRGGHIRLEARREGEQVVAAVHDTGIGIPRESLKRIFDMFSQVDRTLEKTTGGLGIGLALVKGLVEMHDGSIEADSEGPNKGSTFTVRLPVAAPPAPVAASTVDAKSSAKRRILVVDDNQDSADSLAMLLRMLGNEVRTANDGLAALTVAEAFRPEVILMDVGMPKLNGLEATRQLRQQPWGTEPIVIMLTGWGQPEDRERSSAAGCDGHLVKPVDLTSLDSLLAKFRKARVGS